jgi:hypothetical protein
MIIPKSLSDTQDITAFIKETATVKGYNTKVYSFFVTDDNEIMHSGTFHARQTNDGIEYLKPFYDKKGYRIQKLKYKYMQMKQLWKFDNHLYATSSTDERCSEDTQMIMKKLKSNSAQIASLQKTIEDTQIILRKVASKVDQLSSIPIKFSMN